MVTTTPLDDELCQKLLKVEDDLLDATLEGQSAIAAFLGRLSSLTAAASHGIANQILSHRTIALARSVASSVSIMADNFREIEPSTQNIDARRQADIVDIFRRLSLEDLESGSQTGISHDSSPAIEPHLDLPASLTSNASIVTSKPDTNPLPPYIPRAYKWLIKHVHNPYPSNAVKTKMAEESNVALKLINGWFINMRRRIGWTAITKRHFQGSRADTLDCAYRVFVREDPLRLVDKKVFAEFMTMKATAERLYHDRFETSDLAKKLDFVVKDMAGEDKINGALEKEQEAKLKKEQEKLRKQAAQALEKEKRKARKKPQGRTETGGATSTSPPGPTSPEQVVAAGNRHTSDSVVAGRKRRAPPGGQDLVSEWSESISERPFKRCRNGSSSLASAGTTSTSSSSSQASTPAPSTPSMPSDLALDNWLTSISEPRVLPADFSHPSMTSRPLKRRLSESEPDDMQLPLSKRTCGSPISLPMPNPLSSSSICEGLVDIDEILLGLDFTLPNQATVENVPEENVEVNLFNDWTKDRVGPCPLSEPTPAPNFTPIPLQHVDVPTFDIPSVSLVPQESLATNAPDLGENMMQFLSQFDTDGSLSTHQPSSNGTSQPQLSTQFVTLDVTDWSNLLPPRPTPTSTSTTKTGMPLPSFSSLLADALEQMPIPQTTLSSVTNTGSLPTNREAKLEKLRLLREEASRLELEIGAS